jgi:hypothetical protein
MSERTALAIPPIVTCRHGVKFYGANVGSCHNSGHTGLTGPTTLLGINYLFRMLSLQGTNHVDLECIEITQPATCTSQGKQENLITNTAMTQGVATYSWSYFGSDQLPALGESVTITGTNQRRWRLQRCRRHHHLHHRSRSGFRHIHNRRVLGERGVCC